MDFTSDDDSSTTISFARHDDGSSTCPLKVPEYNISNRLRPEEYKQCRDEATRNVNAVDNIKTPEINSKQIKEGGVIKWLSSDEACFIIESPAHSHMLIEKLFDAKLPDSDENDSNEDDSENGREYPWRRSHTKFPILGTTKLMQFCFKCLQGFKSAVWFVLSVWASIALRRARRNPTDFKAARNWQAFKLAVDYNRDLTFQQKCYLTDNNYCSYLAMFARSFVKNYPYAVCYFKSKFENPNIRFRVPRDNRGNPQFDYEQHDIEYMERRYGIRPTDLLQPKTHFLSVLDGYAILAMPDNDRSHRLPSSYYAQFAREGALIGQSDFFANCRLKWTRPYKAPSANLPLLQQALKKLYAATHLCMQNQTELGIEAYVSLINAAADYLVCTTLPVLILLANLVEVAGGVQKINTKKDFWYDPLIIPESYIDFKDATNQATLAATGFSPIILKTLDYFKSYYLEGWSSYDALNLWKPDKRTIIVPECVYGVVGAGLFQIAPLTSATFCPVWHKIKDSLLITINNELKCWFAKPFAGNIVFEDLQDSFEMYMNVLPQDIDSGIPTAAILFNNLLTRCGGNPHVLKNIQQMTAGVEVDDILKHNRKFQYDNPLASGVISGVKNGFLTLFSDNVVLAYDIFGLWKTRKQIKRPQSYTSLPYFSNRYKDADTVIVQLNNAAAMGGYVRHRLENKLLTPPKPEFEFLEGRLSNVGKRANMKCLATLVMFPYEANMPQDIYIVLYVIEMFHALLRNTISKLNQEVEITEHWLATTRHLEAKQPPKITASSYLHCYLHQFVPANVRNQVANICRNLDRGNIKHDNELTPELTLMTNPVVAKFIIDLEQGKIHLSPHK